MGASNVGRQASQSEYLRLCVRAVRDKHTSLYALPPAFYRTHPSVRCQAGSACGTRTHTHQLVSSYLGQKRARPLHEPERIITHVHTYSSGLKCVLLLPRFADQHAPMPNNQTIVFDPADHLAFWPARFEHSKTGLIGGHLRIANVGAFSPSVGKGYELVAFAPVTPGTNGSMDRGPANVIPCNYSGPHNDTYVTVRVLLLTLES